MSSSVVFSSLIEPLQQGGNADVYVRMLADDTEEEIIRTLASCLVEVLQEENSVQNAQLILKWMQQEFNHDNLVTQTSTRVFEQLCHVGRFEHVTPLAQACLGILNKQEQKEFFMEQTLEWLGQTVYHPLFQKSNISSFLNQSLKELNKTLNTTRDHLFYLTQTFIVGQETFGMARLSEDGKERVLDVLEMGRGDKQAELNMFWAVVVDKILDEYEMGQGTFPIKLKPDLKEYTDKVLSFNISFEDILNHKNKKWGESIYHCLLGEEGGFRQEDAFFCLAFVLDQKREDKAWMEQVYLNDKAYTLLEAARHYLTNDTSHTMVPTVHMFCSFMEKSVLAQEIGDQQNTPNTSVRIKKL